MNAYSLAAVSIIILPLYVFAFIIMLWLKNKFDKYESVIINALTSAKVSDYGDLKTFIEFLNKSKAVMSNTISSQTIIELISKLLHN